MSDFTHKQKKPGDLALSGDMTIYAAIAMKKLLLGKLAAVDILKVDLSKVTELDTAGVQVLLLLQQEAARNKKTLTLHGHSQAVTQTLDLLKLGSALGQPMTVVWS